MQHILVYGDSLSWGIIPTTRRRPAFDARWPGVMEGALNAQGRSVLHRLGMRLCILEKSDPGGRGAGRG